MHASTPVRNGKVILNVGKTLEFNDLGIKPRSQFVNATGQLIENMSENLSVVVTERIEITIGQESVPAEIGFYIKATEAWFCGQETSLSLQQCCANCEISNLPLNTSDLDTPFSISRRDLLTASLDGK